MPGPYNSPSKVLSRSGSVDLGLELAKLLARSAPDSSSSPQANATNVSGSSQETRVRIGILIGVLCTMFVLVWSVLICRARRRRAYTKDHEKRNSVNQDDRDVEWSAAHYPPPGRVSTPESQVGLARSSSSTKGSDLTAFQHRESSPMFRPSPLYSQPQLNSYPNVNPSSADLSPPPPAYTRP